MSLFFFSAEFQAVDCIPLQKQTLLLIFVIGWLTHLQEAAAVNISKFEVSSGV